jgi:lipid-binding SYLF domain-containing protein
MKSRKTILMTTASLLLGGVVAVAPALATDSGAANSSTPMNQSQMNNKATSNPSTETTGTTSGAATENGGKQMSQNDAQQLVKDALAEVQTMEKNAKLKDIMAKAKGIYLVPDFGRGAFIVGGRGGAGVVLAKNNGKWSDPVFYDFGAISFGAQVGASGGPVAFLLMWEFAVDQFKSGYKVSLNAESGLTIVNFSADAQASWGKGDIIFWTDTKGAYAGATVSATDLNFADGNNKAYYGKEIDPAEVLGGKSVMNAPEASQLKDALPG